MMMTRETMRRAERLYVTLDERCKVREAADSYYSKIRLVVDTTANRVEAIEIDRSVGEKIITDMVAETETELRSLGFEP